MINKKDLKLFALYWGKDTDTGEYKIVIFVNNGWFIYKEGRYLYPFSKFEPVKEIPEPE